MKKSIFFLFAATLSLASCSTKEEILEESSTRDLSFDTFVDKATTTKAPGANLETLYGNFGVWGYYSSVGGAAWMNVFDSQKENNNNPQLVTFNKTNGTWSYSPIAKWVPKQEYRFYGYAPYYKNNTLTQELKEPINATMQNGANDGIITFTDYTLNGAPTDGSEMEYPAENQLTDLMISTGHARSTNIFDNSSINLNFKHLLTNVNLVFKTTSLYTIDITSVKLHQVKSKGTAVVTLGNESAQGGIIAASPATTWEASEPITIKGKSTTTPLVNSSTSEFRAMENMYMIPQDFDQKALTLEVTYVVGGEDETNSRDNVYTKSISLATTAKAWNPGVRITYTVIINTGNIQGSGNEISFGSTTTTDWLNSDGIINQD